MTASDITAAEEAQINKMNIAAQRADLGTVIEEVQAIAYANSGSIQTLEGSVGTVVTGCQTATLADVDGSAIDLLTGTTGIAGFIVDGFVSGSNIDDFKVINSGSNLTITSASSGYIISVDDVYNWIVW